MSTPTIFEPFIGAPADAARPISVRTKDERWDLSAAARFDLAPDEDEDMIEVPPMSHVDEGTLPLDDVKSKRSPSASSASIGHLLLKGMASNAKKHNPEGLRAVVSSVPHIPSTVGGFLGAGGTTHKAVDVDIGMIVCSTRAAAGASSSTGGANTTSQVVRFKRDEDITEEERTFGSTITEATVATIGQVMHKSTVRTTTAAAVEEWEVGLADGSKATFSRDALRLATPRECELFRRWVDSPESLPSEALRKKRQRDDNRTVAGILASSAAGGASNAAGRRRWVQKRLLVRYVGDERPHLVGKKFIVSSVNYKDDRVLLSNAVPLATGTADDTVLEVVSVNDLETVLPKIGEKGLILCGPHSGQMAMLRKKVTCAESGDVESVVATLCSPPVVTDGDPIGQLEVVLTPDDYCAL